ncbi:hypothetical protein kpv477_268 [Klebsiella phage vB_KpnM_KpV477]|jgi:hypothetical protein|uniref:Uncharacterized protein n=1 Tax=Klebsiella phage vB_KpnM_KpV477 TaxID=1852625 RepID=A0A1B1P9B6_9CAUD|nr:hypothetical protein kpv477_268 [Klebsiella phage vB_KpnM_KpV477]ANT40705.1 hypothetical protein kpv477_268 [Klebsiella phage vB_KpnM_KpV477]UNY41067.1 hypothetical protein [Klebsiella phage KP182]
MIKKLLVSVAVISIILLVLYYGMIYGMIYIVLFISDVIVQIGSLIW